MMKQLTLQALGLLLSIQAFTQPYPDSERDGKYYKVNGANLWEVSVGKGQPLFLVSGGPGSAHIGLRDFDSLAKDNMLVYFDGFGRGKSDTAKVVTEYSLERDIEDIEGLRKAMKLDRINLLGHSYGGVVVQGYALKYPQHVSHLILANTFHSNAMWQANDDNTNHEMKTNYPEMWDSLMVARKRGIISQDAEHQRIYGRVPYGFLYAYNPDNFAKPRHKPYPHSFNTALYYQLVGPDGDFTVGNDIGTFDYRQQLKSFKMPVLIYGGRFDRVATPEMMVKYKEYCPQATFKIFEKSGHNPQVEEPGKLFPVIEKFLGNN
jgi:proline iminopeptidase